ncbi:DUF1737 domain-containing protein [Saccharopolyspora griseoalba]|uniref:DUF1737 domain-containing protein n=1 Tax=Saccharopolyspora griseoalba TaxID=1431848 RepID=A0ABW2LE69_9PSEU
MSEPPDGLPRYRLLTGPDDESFCRRVSEVLALGYELHGPPSVTFNGVDVIAAQASSVAGQGLVRPDRLIRGSRA